jgi:hypothetical protein
MLSGQVESESKKNGSDPHHWLKQPFPRDSGSTHKKALGGLWRKKCNVFAEKIPIPPSHGTTHTPPLQVLYVTHRGHWKSNAVHTQFCSVLGMKTLVQNTSVKYMIRRNLDQTLFLFTYLKIGSIQARISLSRPWSKITISYLNLVFYFFKHHL